MFLSSLLIKEKNSVFSLFSVYIIASLSTFALRLTQFIQIVMNLLDALKTSFSHRSLSARSMGKRDSVSDATVAGLSLLKSYVRTYRNADDKCMQRYMCEANSECVREIGGASIFCQLGS